MGAYSAWVQHKGSWDNDASRYRYIPYDGAHSFRPVGISGNKAELYQLIDLSHLQHEIETDQPFVFQARFADQYGIDTIRIKVDFYDVDENKLDLRIDTFAFSSFAGDLWRQFGDERVLPKSAAFAKVRLIAKRKAGFYADVYVDNLYFDLK